MARKTPAVVKHPSALRDILEIADYLARTASLAVADRFVTAVEKTAQSLARMPGIGTPWDSDEPRLAGMRFFPVTKFPNHLLFYRPSEDEDAIELVRVLHGARDIAGIFEDEA